MAIKKGYDIISPDGIGMYYDKIYSSPEKAEEGFNEWIKRFSHQGYYRDNQRNMIPLNQLRGHCKIVDFDFELDEFEGDFI